jgi:hypothetical protein
MSYQDYVSDPPEPAVEEPQAYEEPPQQVVEPEPEPEQEQEQPKEESKSASRAPQPPPQDIFNILDNNEDAEKKEDVFNEPIKPSPIKEKESPQNVTSISKLNEIMSIMQRQEAEERQKKEAEEKLKKDMVYGAFQPQMMPPGWMPYQTVMPGFRPAGFGPAPYASNMPGMSPMYPPRMPFPMGSVNPLIPTVNYIKN